MKHLKDMFEKRFERVQPKTKEELKSIIDKSIKVLGNNANLNFIDTSKITDMSSLFCNSEFNGDISEWDTSNVTNIGFMFSLSEFNGDISEWNVSEVENMHATFFMAKKFNGDISKWNANKVTDHFFFNEKSKLANKHCPMFKN